MPSDASTTMTNHMDSLLNDDSIKGIFDNLVPETIEEEEKPEKPSWESNASLKSDLILQQNRVRSMLDTSEDSRQNIVNSFKEIFYGKEKTLGWEDEDGIDFKRFWEMEAISAEFSQAFEERKKSMNNKFSEIINRLKKTLTFFDAFRQTMIKFHSQTIEIDDLQTEQLEAQNYIKNLTEELHKVEFEESKFTSQIEIWRAHTQDKDKLLMMTLKREENRMVKMRELLIAKEEFFTLESTMVQRLMTVAMEYRLDTPVVYEALQHAKTVLRSIQFPEEVGQIDKRLAMRFLKNNHLEDLLEYILDKGNIVLEQYEKNTDFSYHHSTLSKFHDQNSLFSSNIQKSDERALRKYKFRPASTQTDGSLMTGYIHEFLRESKDIDSMSEEERKSSPFYLFRRYIQDSIAHSVANEAVREKMGGRLLIEDKALLNSIFSFNKTQVDWRDPAYIARTKANQTDLPGNDVGVNTEYQKTHTRKSQTLLKSIASDGTLKSLDPKVALELQKIKNTMSYSEKRTPSTPGSLKSYDFPAKRREMGLGSINATTNTASESEVINHLENEIDQLKNMVDGSNVDNSLVMKHDSKTQTEPVYLLDNVPHEFAGEINEFVKEQQRILEAKINNSDFAGLTPAEVSKLIAENDARVNPHIRNIDVQTDQSNEKLPPVETMDVGTTVHQLPLSVRQSPTLMKSVDSGTLGAYKVDISRLKSARNQHTSPLLYPGPEFRPSTSKVRQEESDPPKLDIGKPIQRLSILDINLPSQKTTPRKKITPRNKVKKKKSITPSLAPKQVSSPLLLPDIPVKKILVDVEINTDLKELSNEATQTDPEPQEKEEEEPVQEVSFVQDSTIQFEDLSRILTPQQMLDSMMNSQNLLKPQSRGSHLPSQRTSMVSSKSAIGSIALVMAQIHDYEIISTLDSKLSLKLMDIYNQILKTYSVQHRGTFIKIYRGGTGILYTFSSPSKAVQFCLDSQTKLLNAKWPKMIQKIPHYKMLRDSEGKLLFRGLRVTMSVICCTPDIITLSPAGDNYLTQTVKLLMFLNKISKPGLVLISEDVQKEIKGDIMVTNDSYMQAYHDIPKNNITTLGTVYCILPRRLKSRFSFNYPKIKGISIPAWRRQFFEKDSFQYNKSIKKKKKKKKKVKEEKSDDQKLTSSLHVGDTQTVLQEVNKVLTELKQQQLRKSWLYQDNEVLESPGSLLQLFLKIKHLLSDELAQRPDSPPLHSIVPSEIDDDHSFGDHHSLFEEQRANPHLPVSQEPDLPSFIEDSHRNLASSIYQPLHEKHDSPLTSLTKAIMNHHEDPVNSSLKPLQLSNSNESSRASSPLTSFKPSSSQDHSTFPQITTWIERPRSTTSRPMLKVKKKKKSTKKSEETRASSMILPTTEVKPSSVRSQRMAVKKPKNTIPLSARSLLLSNK